MQRREFRFLERLRVRWIEVDMQKIVFNGHYLMYADTAVAGYWRAMAMPYHETMEHLHGDLFVRKATLEYLGSARYDEQLAVGVRCARIGTSSMNLAVGIFRGETLLVHGELVYVFADPATQTSRPVPQALRDLLGAFEKGEPMVEVRLGRWTELRGDAQPLRSSVFVQEQGIPPAIETDPQDEAHLHAVAYNRFGVPVGTGRLIAQAPGEGRIGRIGRMAVRADLRGSGIGTALLEALTRAARERGDQEIHLHAQHDAAPFYERAGYRPHGEPFEEAGVRHLEMRRAL